MTSAVASHITGHAQKVALFAGTLQIYGKRRFMRSTTDPSSLGFRLLYLRERTVAFRTIPKPR